MERRNDRSMNWSLKQAMPKQFASPYNVKKVPLKELLLHYFRIIDPTSKNRQGNDQGTQYRTGVTVCFPRRQLTINQVFEEEAKYDKPLAVEKEPLTNFINLRIPPGYLETSNGYCHIDVNRNFLSCY